MNRVIKFRFWCASHGYVPAGFGTPLEAVHFNQRGELGVWCPFCHKARPMTLEQFTGLLDCASREIYEGDIDADGHVMTYEWGCFRFRKGRHTKPFTPYRGDTDAQCREWEVVGNVHEHPHLLEESA